MRSKKGDTLTLNVIVVAALALIVLVVLIMVFTGRISIFEQGVSKEGQAELVKMKITYGQCKPSATVEANFVTQFGQAEGQVEAEETAKATFSGEISRCKGVSNDQASCASTGCRWG